MKRFLTVLTSLWTLLQVAVAHAVGRAANPANSIAPLQPMPVEPNPTPGVQEAVV
jgi:hypothetical protein